MIVSIFITVGVVVGTGIAVLAGLSLSSPWTVLLLVAFANAGLVAGLRMSSKRRTADSSQGRVMSLVEQTLPHMRLGLSEDTARRTVQLLHEAMRLEAVGLTDRERVLAFVGPGADHHDAGGPLRSGVTRRAIEKGEVVIAADRSEIECDEQDCPLNSCVVAPLVCDGLTVGALKVYRSVPGSPSDNLIELTRALAAMLSLQLELAQAHREAQIAETAKLDALRAQINPHFLFNTLNTIAMKARTEPEEARRLLVRLSDFLRYAMKHAGHLAPFGEEYFFVRTYLFLEQARFGDRLKVRYDVDPQCLSIPVPVLTIQPLVENAVKHGIASQPEGGLVELKARLEPIGGVLRIRVSDNGVGIEQDRLPSLLAVGNGDHSALSNIYERLIRLYGGKASLDVASNAGKGTTVSLSLPVGTS
jgi:LytS/YehU family sensor histidine kinase